MFQKSQTKNKQTQNPTVKPKETFSQSLTNYESIKDKVQTSVCSENCTNKAKHKHQCYLSYQALPKMANASVTAYIVR